MKTITEEDIIRYKDSLSDRLGRDICNLACETFHPKSAWQPISTVPKDGIRPVALYDTQSGVYHMLIPNRIEVDGWTHWMKLEEPK
jgi:hypothetical protein